MGVRNDDTVFGRAAPAATAVNEPIISALLGVFRLVIPEIILLAGACVLFLGATFRTSRHVWGAVALISLILAGIALCYSPRSPTTPPDAEAVIFASPLLVDRVALLVKAIALVAGVILVLCSWDEVPDAQAAEFHGCLLIIVAGLALTGAANELITLFLALELISIPTYVLLYLPRLNNPSQEAAMKYFLLSIFASALLLFGFSYLYGMVGTTNLPALADAMGQARATGLPAVSLIALVMLLAGFGFRITAFPFHFYAPDVYQGTATSAAALLAFMPKAAGFVALLRVLGYIPHELAARPGLVDLLEGNNAFPDAVLGVQVPHLLWILAVVTMSLGNVLALLQDNIKRMLAYSSVAHAGYMLIGLVVARFQPAGAYDGSVDAVLFYLIAYGAMTVGAFTVLVYLSTPQRPVETVDDIAGLGRSHPGVALLMTLFLFSLIGIPLTAGFAGKLLLFWGALEVPAEPMSPVWFRLLALIAAINAAVGAWYYLRLVMAMWLRNPLQPLPQGTARPALGALVLCAVITLVGGVYPNSLLAPVRSALPHASPAAGQEGAGARPVPAPAKSGQL
jgi:NADH-quinone oxidoreductase subunit N